MTLAYESRIFHLGDVLSVTTSVLVSPRSMYGVYDIVQYLTRSEPALDALDASILECRGLLLAQHPQFEDVDTADVEFENWQKWLDEQVARFGEWVTVQRSVS
jgi:hypothetical protein